MKNKENKIIHLKKSNSLSPRVATWYAQFEEVRKNLLKQIEDLDDAGLDFTPDERKIETIGTLLLHIAAIEWSWIFEDIDHKEMDKERIEKEHWNYAFALRSWANLPQLTGKGKQFFIERLTDVRQEVYQRISEMKDEDLDRIVTGEDPDDGYTYTIEWILYHIIEHEALHLGQVNMVKRLYNLQKPGNA